jgi:MOSC domain-containing protein YiiM
MSSQGKVESIYVRPKPSKPVLGLDQVVAIPGKGLQGDYYSSGISRRKVGPDREITLIESESLSFIETEYEVSLAPGESRRNIITSNMPLNQLVGIEFVIGSVKLRGLRLCEPCNHLVELTQKEVIPALVHRGGLRAQILTEGTIQIGDPIYALEESPAEEVHHVATENRS